MSQSDKPASEAAETQKRTIEQSQRAFQQAFSVPLEQTVQFQKSAATALVNGLEVGTWAQRQWLDLADDALSTYFDVAEDVVRDAEEMTAQGSQQASQAATSMVDESMQQGQQASGMVRQQLQEARGQQAQQPPGQQRQQPIGQQLQQPTGPPSQQSVGQQRHQPMGHQPLGQGPPQPKPQEPPEQGMGQQFAPPGPRGPPPFAQQAPPPGQQVPITQYGEQDQQGGTEGQSVQPPEPERQDREQATPPGGST